MILDEKQREHLMRLIDSVASSMYGNSYWWTLDIVKVVLEDELYHAVFNYNKYPELINNIPKTHRKKVLKAIETLRKNINKARELLLENPPDWVKNAVLAEFLREFYHVSSIPILEEHREELLRTLPADVKSWHEVKYKNKRFEGLILYPTEKELEKLEIPSVGNLYQEYFANLFKRIIKFIPERQSVKIYDFEILFPRKEYYEVLKRFDQYDTIVELVKEDMGEVLNELEQIGEVTLSHENIKIKVRPEIINRINSEYGLDITELELYFGFDPSTGVGKSGRIWAKLSTGTFSISKPYLNICYTGKCKDADISEFRFNNYSELPGLAHFMIDRIVELIAFTKSIETKFLNTGRSRGYKLDRYYGIDYLSSYSNISKFRLYKETDKYRVEVSLYIDYEKNSVTASYDIYVWIRRNVPSEVIEEFKYRMITEGINRSFKMREKQRKYWNIVASGIELSHGLSGIENVFSEAERVAEIASKIYNDYVIEAKKKREAIKLSPEQYMAIYITNNTIDGAYIPVERATGRPEIVMYSVISRIASKHGVTGSPAKDTHYIILDLFEAGYIKVDRDLKLYINGKRYVDLLKPVKDEVLPTVALSWESRIASWLISRYIYRRVGGGLSKTGYVKALHEKGLFSDKILYELLSSREIYIPPEDMAYKIDGKPAWHHLSPATKKLYIEGLYQTDKEQIYFNPALSTVFNDVIKDIERDLIESGDPSVLTRLAVEAKPKLIGLSKHADIRIVRDKSKEFYGIDMGAFVVQVGKLGVPPEDNEFIVYRKDTKIGFVFRGRTIGDAIADASTRYDKIYQTYERILKEYEKRREVGDGFVLMHRSIGEYKVPYLIKADKILYINEHTPSLIKKRPQFKVEEEVV